MRLSKKIIVTLLIFLQVFLLSSSLGASAAKAASIGPWWNQGPGQFYLKVHEQDNPAEIFGERYTTAQVDWIIWSVLLWLPTKIVGEELMNCLFSQDAGVCVGALFADSSIDTPVQNFAYEDNQKGLISSMFEDRDLSAVTYVRNIGRRFHIVPEAQAQLEGFGYEVLSPVQGMWKGVRDVSYMLFAIVAIAFAFMIMFRVKLSPQTVLTVQSALPKIFIALILVTFSYAIAGLLVDLMYVVIGLISFMFSRMFDNFLGLGPKMYFNFMTKGQPFGIDINIGVIFLLLFYPVLLLVTLVLVFITTFGLLGVALGGLAANVAVGTIIGVALIPGINIIAGIILIIALLIVAIMMILFIFRIFWMLLKAFAAIVLLTIFAPLQITLGVVIPSLGFGRWVKSYVSNLAIFVATGTMFLLAFMFLFQAMAIQFEQISQISSLGEGLVEALFGVNNQFSNMLSGSGGSNSWPPLIGGGTQLIPLLFIGVSLVIFFAIPKTADMIKSFIGGQPFSYGSAIGEAMRPMTATGGAAIRTAVSGVQDFGSEQVATGLRNRLGTATSGGTGTSPGSQSPPGSPGGGSTGGP